MKKNTECSVVQDLLTLSVDGLISEKSELLINSHLNNCLTCQKHLETITQERNQKENRENENENRLKRALKKWRYEMIGLISGIAFIFVVIVISVLRIFFHSGNIEDENYSIIEHYEHVQDYGKQDYRGIAKLSLFPEANCINGTIKDFFYDCKGQRLYQHYQIYLECSYDSITYEAEKERLLNVTDEQTEKKVSYSEDETAFPCIYAMLYDEGYEYALLSEQEHKIIYIYLQGIDRRDLYFSPDYLPKDYGQAGYNFETERDPFRIYEKD